MIGRCLSVCIMCIKIVSKIAGANLSKPSRYVCIIYLNGIEPNTPIASLRGQALDKQRKQARFDVVLVSEDWIRSDQVRVRSGKLLRRVAWWQWIVWNV